MRRRSLRADLLRPARLPVALALAPPARRGRAGAAAGGFQDEVVFEGLEQPTNFRFAPDGRVFVAEKPGEILVYDSLDDTTPTLFADLRTEVYDNGDRGLLGLALDPEFDAGRPYVYALYTYDHVLGEPRHRRRTGANPDTSGDPCPNRQRRPTPAWSAAGSCA